MDPHKKALLDLKKMARGMRYQPSNDEDDDLNELTASESSAEPTPKPQPDIEHFEKRGPDPEDDATVTEFTHRSQDPRAVPWEALRRGGATLDSYLHTGPGSTRSELDQGVQNLGRYLNQPVPGQPWPGPEVGPTRDVGHFESLAQKIPDTLTSPTFQAMAFPTGEESLARMKDEAVFRDQMEAKGAREVDPRTIEPMAGQPVDQWNASARDRISEANNANDEAWQAKGMSGGMMGHGPPWYEVGLKSELDAVRQSPNGRYEAMGEIREPSSSPERSMLEEYFNKRQKR